MPYGWSSMIDDLVILTLANVSFWLRFQPVNATRELNSMKARENTKGHLMVAFCILARPTGLLVSSMRLALRVRFAALRLMKIRS